MSLNFASIFRRIIPRYSTTKTEPPDDFDEGELVVNFTTGQLFAKHPNGTVYRFPSADKVGEAIAQAMSSNPQGPGAPVGARILYADNTSTLYDQRQTYNARSYTLPAGTLGSNSRIDIRAQLNSQQGNNTRIRLIFGGVEICSFPIYWGKTYVASRSVRNRGVLNQQLCNSWGGNYGEVSDVFGEVVTLAVDTAQPVLIELEVDNSGGGDRRCRVDSFEVVLWP